MSDVINFPGQMTPDEVVEMALERVKALPPGATEQDLATVAKILATAKLPDYSTQVRLPEGLTDEQVAHIEREFYQQMAKLMRIPMRSYAAYIALLTAAALREDMERRLGPRGV